MEEIIRKYGWIPQPNDERDLKYAVERPTTKLPSSIDLRPGMPPIYDQGNLGSCTANGIARAYQYAAKKAGLPVVMPSRLFLYYNEREVEGTVNTDSGAIIRDGFKVCNKFGVVDETYWPYKIEKFTEKPPKITYDIAIQDRIRYYASLNNRDLNALKTCLYHEFPIVFGIQVYAEFENYTSGVLQKPSYFERCLGGHCMCICGYDDSRNAFLVANSWGTSYGDEGYCWISYDYITSRLCSDFWMLRLK